MTYYCTTFGKEMLRKLGAPYTKETDVFLRAWAQAENTNAVWNPYATTQWAKGSTNFNSVGVKNYPTWQVGVDTTVKTLLNGKYDNLVRAIRAGRNSLEMAQALKDSKWGTGGLVLEILNSGGPREYPVGVCYSAQTYNGVTTNHWRWSRTIKPGMTGRDVDELLRHFSKNTASFFNFNKSDGEWAQKVKNYQRLRPWLWPADGIVGPKTYKSITGHD